MVRAFELFGIGQNAHNAPRLPACVRFEVKTVFEQFRTTSFVNVRAFRVRERFVCLAIRVTPP